MRERPNGRDWTFFTIGAAGVISFLSGLVWFVFDFPPGSDRELLYRIVDMRTPALTVPLKAVSMLGNEYLLLALGTVFITVLLFKKEYWLGAKLYLLGTGLWLLNLSMKALIGRDRPAGSGWLVDAVGGSFPSGHAMVASTLWGLIIVYCFRGRPRYFTAAIASWLAFSMVMGFSRVYLGVHYPSDVIAGLGLSFVFVSTGYLLIRNEGSQ